MGVKLNPKNSLAKFFKLNYKGDLDSPSDVFERKIKQRSSERANFSPSVTDNEAIINESLAPSFGDACDAAESVRELDDNMKLMIASSIKKLLELKKKYRVLDWKKVQGSFNTNPCLVPMGEPLECIQDYVSESSRDFRFDGSPDPALVQKVMYWWESSACPDVDMRNDSKLDIRLLAEVVACCGTAIVKFTDVWSKRERHEKKMLEIGVMRIQLHAWSDCSRTLWHQEDKNGIRSVIHSQCYRPNDKFLDGFREAVRQKAITEVEDMFLGGEDSEE